MLIALGIFGALFSASVIQKAQQMNLANQQLNASGD
jgi:hypothetical protein